MKRVTVRKVIIVILVLVFVVWPIVWAGLTWLQ
jgi:nitrate reductase NapE component